MEEGDYDPPLSCYCFDDADHAAGTCNGGSMCDGDHEYTMELLFSDPNY